MKEFMVGFVVIMLGLIVFVGLLKSSVILLRSFKSWYSNPVDYVIAFILLVALFVIIVGSYALGENLLNRMI